MYLIQPDATQNRLLPATLLALICCVVLCVPVLAAEDLVVSGGSTECSVDAETGAISELRVAGDALIERSADQYTLELPDPTKTLESSEKDDRVTQARRFTDLSGVDHLWLRCRNDSLKIWVNKSYRIERGTGLLFKRIEVEADRGVNGLFVHESGLSVSRDFWKGASIWRPTWHEHGSPFLAVDGIQNETNLRNNNATRAALTLFQPKRQETIVHWRWGGETFEWFESFVEKPPFGYRVWPRRWLLADSLGFVGGELNKRLTSQMVYGVIGGSPLDFMMQYVSRDEFQRLCVEPMKLAPAWLRDAVIDDAFDVSALPGNYKEFTAAFLTDKHPGYIQSVWWHPFQREYYIARPSDLESQSKEDPAGAAEFIAEMKQVSPRFKLGPYTHYGHPSANPQSALAAIGAKKGWVPTKRDGTRVDMGADYDPRPDGAVPLNRTAPEYRQHLEDRWAELFDYFGSDLFYTDSAPIWGRCEIDWGTRTSGNAAISQALYRDMQLIAAGRGAAFPTNYPVGFGTSGFTEFSWYQLYKEDWRFTSGRLAIQQALNFAPRRLYMCGYIHPAGTMKDESIRIHVNYMTLLGIGFSLLDVKAPNYKEQFYREGAPYLQAAWEIRNRNMVDANVRPDWLDLKGQTEAYAWRSLDGYGLITAMSHDAKPVKQRLSFDAAPLGATPGRPVYVWVTQMADARTHDFSSEKWGTPPTRLAEQRLAYSDAECPERLEITVELTHENPVTVLVTDSPVLVTSVGGRQNQYWLPPVAPGLTAKVVADGSDGRMTFTVDSPQDAAEVIAMLPPKFKDAAKAVQRKWSENHPAGVAPGFDAVEHEIVRIGDHRFVKVKVGKGATEINVE